MSTIALPALRKPWANLHPYTVAGDINSGTSNPIGASFSVTLAAAGLAVGDLVSGSAEILNAVSLENSRFEITARDGSATILATVDSGYANNTSFTRRSAVALTIPASTATIRCNVRRQSGTGSMSIRNVILNRGATAATYLPPSRGATAPWTNPSFHRDNEQSVQSRNSGTSQITTFPSRRWLSQFKTAVLGGDELREWSLAIDQLSDLNNVFRLVPPSYTGPSTGYLGPNPAVMGAGQLGSDLDVDGLDASTAILKAGDYCSFEVTSGGGSTNVQLFKLAADVTSDGSGVANLTFTTPIRQAPADNAVVQIHSPTAQMAFVTPRAGLDLGSLRRAEVQVDAEERIWP